MFDDGAGHRGEYWDDVRKIRDARNVVVRPGESVTGKDAQLAPFPYGKRLKAQVKEARVKGRPRVGGTLRLRNRPHGMAGEPVSARMVWFVGRNNIIRIAPRLKITRQVKRLVKRRVVKVRVIMTLGGVTRHRTIRVGRVA